MLISSKRRPWRGEGSRFSLSLRAEWSGVDLTKLYGLTKDYCASTNEPQLQMQYDAVLCSVRGQVKL